MWRSSPSQTPAHAPSTEASRESWSVRELERQIAAMLFERLALKGDEKQLAAEGQQIFRPHDVK